VLKFKHLNVHKGSISIGTIRTISGSDRYPDGTIFASCQGQSRIVNSLEDGLDWIRKTDNITCMNNFLRDLHEDKIPELA
jgi:hypothetical protein